MIHVIAVITARPGQRETILALFRANVPAVKAEKGCIEYGAAVDAENALVSRPSGAPTPSSWSRNGRAWTRSRRTPRPRTWQRTGQRRKSSSPAA